MKKTLFFGIIAASLGFTACSSEDDAILGENTQKKGIVLKAAVDQPAETRASINNSGSTWRFSFTNGDGLKVNNTEHAAFYDFSTTDGAEFSCDNAFTTTDPATWYAYYPSESISLLNQTGNIADVASRYALAGATTTATNGADGLAISMKPQVAILHISQYWDKCNIQVKTSDTEYVTGLSAKSGEAAFDVTTNSSLSTLFSAPYKGWYQVAVPAGKQISIKDGDVTIKSTGAEGLTAGKFYVLYLEQANIYLDGREATDKAENRMVFQDRSSGMTVTLTLSSEEGPGMPTRFNDMGDIEGEDGTLTITIDNPSGMKIKKIIAEGFGGNQTLTGNGPWNLNISHNEIETIGILNCIKVLSVK